MTNDEIIKWVETIKSNIDQLNVDDPKDFNDLKNCCDDFIAHVKDPQAENSYDDWKIN